jgi:prepilin-type N-terminal cleavage/methylation domain-containing protein
MKTLQKRITSRLQAFTLIELLVVISIIALLAALTVPAIVIAMNKQRLNRAKTEMAQIETAIDTYKAARGHFPPDNPANFAQPQLFYELTGTYFRPANPKTFVRLNGGETITEATVLSGFGVSGFVNTSETSDISKEAIKQLEARDFFSTIKPTQYGINPNNLVLLGVPIEGVGEFTTTTGKRLTPWHYNSSNPTNNTETFDLWVDIILRGKTNRICNWSDTPVPLN